MHIYAIVCMYLSVCMYVFVVIAIRKGMRRTIWKMRQKVTFSHILYLESNAISIFKL